MVLHRGPSATLRKKTLLGNTMRRIQCLKARTASCREVDSDVEGLCGSDKEHRPWQTLVMRYKTKVLTYAAADMTCRCGGWRRGFLCLPSDTLVDTH